MSVQTVIMDIDGTLADASWRMHLRPKIALQPDGSSDRGSLWDIPEWASFLTAARQDVPYKSIVTMNNALAKIHTVVMSTARDERQRADTIAWLNEHNVCFHELKMRPYNDLRPSAEIKREHIQALRAVGYKPILGVDDEERNIEMFRAEGIPALHVRLY